jgi:small subunit ribosomal protein S8
MSMQDAISDMLTRIRNGHLVSKKQVTVPHTKLKLAIVKVLLDEGFISAYKEEKGVKPTLIIVLKYHKDNIPVIEGMTRVSRPSLRVYRSYRSLPKVVKGFGIAILSTARGVVSHHVARQLKVGGEVLCEVW